MSDLRCAQNRGVKVSEVKVRGAQGKIKRDGVNLCLAVTPVSLRGPALQVDLEGGEIGHAVTLASPLPNIQHSGSIPLNIMEAGNKGAHAMQVQPLLM